MADATEYTPTLFVYIGRGIGKDKVTGGKYVPLDLLKRCETRAQAEEKASLFAMKDRELPRAIGFVYSIKAKLDENGGMIGILGNHIPDGNQAEHKINREWIAHWQATDRAEQVAKRARKLETEYKLDELRERLAPLKHDWGKTDKIGRLALEVVILDILRGQP